MKKILIIFIATLSLVQADDWKNWAQKIEKIHPITDAQGHGPDIGSDEWANALSKKLGVIDKDGHGPDIKSDEWKAAVEHKLKDLKREIESSHSAVKDVKP